jgi:hypothetical protein
LDQKNQLLDHSLVYKDPSFLSFSSNPGKIFEKFEFSSDFIDLLSFERKTFGPEDHLKGQFSGDFWPSQF